MTERLRVKADDLESYERCPRAYDRRRAGVRGTAVPSRALERSRLVSDAIVSAHRLLDPPSYDELKRAYDEARELSSPAWSPANGEEREEILGMLDIYAEIAAELGGEIIERGDPSLARDSKRSSAVLTGWERLLFRHPAPGCEPSQDSPGELPVIETRRVTSSRYRPSPGPEELAAEFRSHVRHLLVDGVFREHTVRISEVNVLEGTWASVDRQPGGLREAGDAVLHFVSMVAADADMEPRPNFLCGNCPYLPDCRAIPRMDEGEIW